MQVPDVTKLTWQLNVALIGAIFAAISLVYNDGYIYYGFVTFLFGVVSHFFSTWFEFVYSSDNQKKERAHFYYIQTALVVAWFLVLLKIFLK